MVSEIIIKNSGLRMIPFDCRGGNPPAPRRIAQNVQKARAEAPQPQVPYSDSDLKLLVEMHHPRVHQRLRPLGTRVLGPAGHIDDVAMPVSVRHFRYLKPDPPQSIASRALRLWGVDLLGPETSEAGRFLFSMVYNTPYTLSASSVGVVTIMGAGKVSVLKGDAGASLVCASAELATLLDLPFSIVEREGKTCVSLEVPYQDRLIEDLEMAKALLEEHARRACSHFGLSVSAKDEPAMAQMFIRDLTCTLYAMDYDQNHSTVGEIYDCYCNSTGGIVPYDKAIEQLSFVIGTKRVTGADEDKPLAQFANPGDVASAQLLVVGGKKKKATTTMAKRIGGVGRSIRRAVKNSGMGGALGHVASALGGPMAEPLLSWGMDNWAAMGRGQKTKMYKQVSSITHSLRISENTRDILRACMDPFNPTIGKIYIGTGGYTQSQRVCTSVKFTAWSGNGGYMFVGVAPCVCNDFSSLFYTDGSAGFASYTPFTNASTPAIQGGWKAAGLTSLPYTSAQVSGSDTTASSDFPVGRVVLAAMRLTNVSSIQSLSGVVAVDTGEERDNYYGATLADIMAGNQNAPVVSSRNTIVSIIFPITENECAFDVATILMAPPGTSGSIIGSQMLYPLSGGTVNVPLNTANSVGGATMLAMSTMLNGSWEVEYVQYTEYVGERASYDYSDRHSDPEDWALCVEIMRSYQDVMQRAEGIDSAAGMRAAIATVAKRHNRVDIASAFSTIV